MYFNVRKGMERSERTLKLADSKFELYCEGLLFFPGIEEGEPSFRRLLDDLRENDSHATIIQKTMGLRGSWCLFIHNIINDTWVACANHSHQSFLYYSSNSISNSFLRLRSDIPDKTRLSEEALLFMLYCGKCYSYTSFYEAIKILDYHDYLFFRDGKISSESKRLPDVLVHDGYNGDFLSFINSYFFSLRKHKICLDLSGGTDTRAIAICLHHLGFDFDVTTNGDRHYTEVQIAQNVGHAIGKELKYFELSPHNIDGEDLRRAWISCDGLGLTLASYLFEAWRKQLGYTVAVSATAGELYKDGGWYIYALQYGLGPDGKSKMIRKLMESGWLNWGGLPYNVFREFVSDRYKNMCMELLRSTADKLIAENKLVPLFEASDRIFFNYSFNFPAGTGNNVINRFQPLLEPDLVRIGVNQPFLMRLNHNFYRQSIGRLNTEAARIASDRIGLNLSHHIFDLMIGYVQYFNIYFRKTLRMKTPSFKNKNNNLILISDYILRHPDLKDALSNLKDKDIINPSISMESLDMIKASRILTLNYLMET